MLRSAVVIGASPAPICLGGIWPPVLVLTAAPRGGGVVSIRCSPGDIAALAGAVGLSLCGLPIGPWVIGLAGARVPVLVLIGYSCRVGVAGAAAPLDGAGPP